MAYISLARKYRPRTFDEIMGQEHVATTLKNAIAMDMVSHAYLFAGPRGVGKTSTARILAKSLNCEKGPTHEPCSKCVSCREISEGTNMDVIEIDGASNRGIDEIRNLKESIKFASIHGKFRIYIIDEVHMLTSEAFNALLKTLEEPPLHAKFIFATTMPHKVLPTILSRCQRFDFRKISAEDIEKKLKEIRKKELLSITDEAITLVAKSSEGSLRDGEVILDQLLSFAEGNVEVKDVTKVLGLLEEDALFGIADSILNNNKEKILNLINSLIQNGKDPIFIASSIITHFRNLLVAKVTEEKDGSLAEQAKGFSLDEILYVTYTLSNAMDLIKKTSLGRIPLEISLIKLTEREKIRPIKELLDRVSLLEQNLEKFSATDSRPGLANPGRELVGVAVKTAPLIPEREIAAERDVILLQKIKSFWPKIIHLVKSKKISVAMFLSEGALLKVNEQTLFMGFDKDNIFHKEAMEEAANKKFVEEAMEGIIGEKVLLRFEVVERQIEKEPIDASDGEPEEVAEGMPDKINRIDPIVESALDIFGGRVVDIREARREEKK